MNNLAKPIFRSIMSALMVSGAMSLVMPILGIVQSTRVLVISFVALVLLLSIYELAFGPRDA